MKRGTERSRRAEPWDERAGRQGFFPALTCPPGPWILRRSKGSSRGRGFSGNTRLTAGRPRILPCRPGVLRPESTMRRSKEKGSFPGTAFHWIAALFLAVGLPWHLAGIDRVVPGSPESESRDSGGMVLKASPEALPPAPNPAGSGFKVAAATPWEAELPLPEVRWEWCARGESPLSAELRIAGSCRGRAPPLPVV